MMVPASTSPALSAEMYACVATSLSAVTSDAPSLAMYAVAA